MTDILTIAKNAQLEILRNSILSLEKFQQTADLKTITFSRASILSDENISELANSIPPSGKFIYYFTTRQYQNISAYFKKFSGKTDLKLARLNVHEGSMNLYVGSSNSLQKRFKEHCGLASKTTYAIKFREWLTDDNIQIEFNYFSLEIEDQTILQNIEDGLWKTMKPIFGKFGGKY